MNHVPPRTAHAATAPSGIVIAETVDHGIPDRPEVVYQESFRKGDPYGLYHQETTAKLTDVQIVGLFDRFCMLS